MAQHPQRHPPHRRRAAALRARFRRRLAARSRQAVRDLRRPHPRHLPVDARPIRPAGRRAARRWRRCSSSAAAPASGSFPTRSTTGSTSTATAAPSILQIAEDDDRVLSVNSFSKAWAMTGWRVGWLTHPSGVADQLARHDAVRQQRHGRPDPGRRRGGDHARASRWSRRSAQRIKTGLDLAYDRLAHVPGIILPTKPRGGMYAFFALEGETMRATPVRRHPGKGARRAGAGLSVRQLRPVPSCACACAATPSQLETALDRMVDDSKN